MNSFIKNIKKIPAFRFALTLPRKYDFLLLLCCLIVSIIGIIYIGSASMSIMFESLADLTNSADAMMVMVWAIVKQSAYLVISLIAMCIVANAYRFEWFRMPLSFDHFYTLKEKFRKNYVFLPVFALIILGMLLLCLVFTPINGTRAWINLGFMTLQPVEFAKVIMIMIIAGAFCKARSKATWVQLIMPVLGIYAIYFVVVLGFQNDLGSAVILSFITLACCFTASDVRLRPVQKWVAIAFAGAVLFAIFIFSPMGASFVEMLPIQEYQANRITTALDPFAHRYDTGYQVSNSLIAFARGGLFGSGLGTSVQKFGYLPYASSDIIIGVIAEEGGFITLAFIFLLYGIILARLVMYAVKMKKDENKVILIGAATYLFTHFLFNVGGATAFIPLTGVPLIMLSSGGSSLLGWYMAMGLCQSVIARYRRGEE